MLRARSLNFTILPTTAREPGGKILRIRDLAEKMLQMQDHAGKMYRFHDLTEKMLKSPNHGGKIFELPVLT